MATNVHKGPIVSVRSVALLVFIVAVSLLMPVDEIRLREVTVALVALGLIVGLQVFVSMGSRPPWLVALPAFGFFVVVALLRDASGGSTSGLTSLVAAPTVYLAFVGTRRQLQEATLLTGLTFVVPLLLIGGPRYTPEDLRRALIWMAIVAVVGPLVQRLVQSLHDQSDEAQRARARLQLVLDAAELSSMIVTDTHGTISSFGVGAERLLGLGAAEMVGRNLADLHDPAELAAVASELGVEPGFQVLAALGSRSAANRVWAWMRSDDTSVTVRSATTELRDDGVLVGYLTVGIDVTEGVRSREALRMAEQRWRVLMDHLPDMTLLVADRNLDITLISGGGAMRAKIGHQTGRPLSEVVSPDNVAVLTALSIKAMAGATGVLDLNNTLTGHEHDVMVLPLPYSHGVTDALILARDVSRERARERALMQAKERAQRMFLDAPVAILLHDGDGLILSANPSALRLFETTRDTLIGSNLALLSGAVDTAPEKYLARLRDTGVSSAEGRWSLNVEDGREKFFSVSGRALHDDPDHPDLVLTHVVDRTEQHLYEQQLMHLADHDPLTGLANRRRFDTELARHLDTCRRYGAEGALLLLDLDHFKQVNDTLGHPVGDQLLTTIAELMTEDLRASDTVARLGGDEFAVLLPRVTRGDVEVVASSLIRTVRRAMQRHDGPVGEVTVSMGVIMVEDADLTAEQVLAVADLALYQAKQRGRDQYAVYDPAPRPGPVRLTGLPGGRSDAFPDVMGQTGAS